jgi:uncharacterized protein (TIGR00304 family)
MNGRGSLRWLGPVLLALGIATVIAAVLTGSAKLFLLFIVPVITGSSWELLVGIALIFLGIFLLPVTWNLMELSDSNRSTGRMPESSTSARGEPSASSVGGVILIGPVPIFFGAWRGKSLWIYAVAAAIGLGLLILAWFYFAGLL